MDSRESGVYWQWLEDGRLVLALTQAVWEVIRTTPCETEVGGVGLVLVGGDTWKDVVRHLAACGWGVDSA